MRDRVFASAVFLCATLLVSALIWVLYDVVREGIAHFSWSFLILEPQNAGRSGGIGPILVSTVWILAIALAVALPVGLAVAIWLSEFASQHKYFKQGTGIALDVLAGVPSIVYGLFGNAFFSVYLGLGYSLLSGGLTLACMILPVFVRTSEAGLQAIHPEWRHAAMALGMTRSTAVWHILLPAARPAILSGVMLSIGRATAETAALLFTSGYVDRMPSSWLDSGKALAVHIYDLSMNVTGGNGAAYTSALVLIILIIFLNTLAQFMLDLWFKRRQIL